MDEAAELRIPARVDRIGLYESLTGGGPARYEPLEVVALDLIERPPARSRLRGGRTRQ